MPISNLTLEPWKVPSASEISQRLEQTRLTGQQTQGQALSNRDANYKYQRAAAVNRVLSDPNVLLRDKDGNPSGEIDWPRVFSHPEAKAYGLQPDLLAAWLGQKTAVSDTQVKTVRNAAQVGALGADQSKMTPPELVGTKTVEKVPTPFWEGGGSQNTAATVADYVFPNRGYSAGMGNKTPRHSSAPAPDPGTPQGQGGADTNTVQVTGSAPRTDAGTYRLPDINTEQVPVTRPLDAVDRVSLSYDPNNTGGGAAQGRFVDSSQIPATPQELERYRNGIQAAGGRALPVGATQADILQAANDLAKNRAASIIAQAGTDPEKLIAAAGAIKTVGQDLISEINKGGISQIGEIQGQKIQDETNTRANKAQESQFIKESYPSLGFGPGTLTPTEKEQINSAASFIQEFMDSAKALKTGKNADGTPMSSSDRAQNIRGISNAVQNILNISKTQGGEREVQGLIQVIPGVSAKLAQDPNMSVFEAIKQQIAAGAAGSNEINFDALHHRMRGIVSHAIRGFGGGKNKEFESRFDAWFPTSLSGGTASTTTPRPSGKTTKSGRPAESF